ncbi:hypothetical protein EMCRGX_G021377 [Ephydatia muelleri]
MFVIMVRGLLSKLCFPYAQFAATTLNGDMIFDPIWEAVSRLEQCGFKVLTITADGTSSHRSLFKIHGVSGSSGYRTLNPHSAEERYIYFISDPPHLIKTVRNCFSKQLLWCTGKGIQWKYVVDLYVQDNDRGRVHPGLRKVPKLKYAKHIDLTSFSKMRADLAAQLSKETLLGIRFTGRVKGTKAGKMDYQNRYRPTERGNQFGKEEAGGIRKDTGAILEDIDVDLNRLDECVQSIGTSLDSPKNHSEMTRLKGVIMGNIQTAEDDIKDMRQKAVGPQKVKVDQYQKKLVSQVTKFNNLLQKAKTETEQHQGETNRGPPPPYDSRGSGSQQQAQAQVGSSAMAIREAEHNEVIELEQDILGLRDIQHDLAAMVNEQGEMIDDIEKHTTDAQVRTENANKNLAKAVSLQKQRRKLICIIAIILIIVALVIVIALAIGLGVGLTYAGVVTPTIPTSIG